MRGKKGLQAAQTLWETAPLPLGKQRKLRKLSLPSSKSFTFEGWGIFGVVLLVLAFFFFFKGEKAEAGGAVESKNADLN